jgi:hypothetical protein
VNLFPYLFLLFMLIGGARLYQMHRAQPETLPAIQRDLEQALAASAHEIAVSEEEHQHHPAHVPGPPFHPAPAGTGSGVGMISAAGQSPTGANIVSASRRTE